MTVFVQLRSSEGTGGSSRIYERVKIHKIKSFEIHDKYDKDTRSAYYDIAIVELTKEIRFGNGAWPICIPEKIDGNKNKYRKKTVSVIGCRSKTHEDHKIDWCFGKSTRTVPFTLA